MAEIPDAVSAQRSLGSSPDEAQRRDIVVIGASSGGLEVLKEIVGGLPANLAAAVFIVVHVPAHGTSWLPEILSRAGRLPASHARHNESIEHGRIYVAPRDYHMLLRDRSVHVVRGPKENNHRPAIDPLFRSAARYYGPRAVGAVLSGTLDDGAAGLASIKNRGGIALVQDPDDALFGDMPRAALLAARVDYRARGSELAKLIARVTQEVVSLQQGAIATDRLEKETDFAALSTEVIEDGDKPGKPSVYGCPECGGTLREMEEDQWLRFRCRVGHAFSADTLLRTQSEGLESALWNAYRLLHENAALAKRVAKRARANKYDRAAARIERRGHVAEQQAELIRGLLMSEKLKPEPTAEGRPEVRSFGEREGIEPEAKS